MEHPHRSLIVCLLIILMSVRHGAAMGPFEEKDWSVDGEHEKYGDWADVFERAPRVALHKVLTGYVLAGPDILINPKDPRTPDAYQQKIWVPSPAYIIEHPKFGAFALDAGLRAGQCDYGTRPFYWVPCKSEPGMDLTSYVKSHQIQLNGVIISHFHGDHVSGLSDLLGYKRIDVLASGQEIRALRSLLPVRFGYEAHMFDRPMTLRRIDSAFEDMPILGQLANLFGDGSVWLIPTPGHTNGHLSVLIVTAKGPVLLTFDVSHLKAGFEHGIRPGFVTRKEQADNSLNKLRQLTGFYPEIQIIFGHEPSQWEALDDEQEVSHP